MPTPLQPPTPRAVILAAGGSTRMGRPKACLMLEGQPLIAHWVQRIRAAGGVPLVVLGAHEQRILAALPSGTAVVRNHRWARSGPSESLRLGLAQIPPEASVWVTPVDAAPCPVGVLLALRAVGADAVPTHAGQDGHPICLGPHSRPAPNQILRDHLRMATRVPVAWPHGAHNLNTPAAWQAFLRRDDNR